MSQVCNTTLIKIQNETTPHEVLSRPFPGNPTHTRRHLFLLIRREFGVVSKRSIIGAHPDSRC